MRITESQLRRIIAEETQKFKKGKRINESQASAEEMLANAMDEYVDQMNAAGFGYEEICEMMQNSVSGYCETLLENLAPEDRDPEYRGGGSRLAAHGDDSSESENLPSDIKIMTRATPNVANASGKLVPMGMDKSRRDYRGTETGTLSARSAAKRLGAKEFEYTDKDAYEQLTRFEERFRGGFLDFDIFRHPDSGELYAVYTLNTSDY